MQAPLYIRNCCRTVYDAYYIEIEGIHLRTLSLQWSYYQLFFDTIKSGYYMSRDSFCSIHLPGHSDTKFCILWWLRSETFYRVSIQPKRYSISFCKTFWSKWKYIVGERIAKMKRQCPTSVVWLALSCGKKHRNLQGNRVRRIVRNGSTDTPIVSL